MMLLVMCSINKVACIDIYFCIYWYLINTSFWDTRIQTLCCLPAYGTCCWHRILSQARICLIDPHHQLFGSFIVYNPQIPLNVFIRDDRIWKSLLVFIVWRMHENRFIYYLAHSKIIFFSIIFSPVMPIL